MDRFIRSFRVCHLEFYKEAISDGCRSEIIPGIGGGFWILIDFRELNFCGPCGPCFPLMLCFSEKSFPNHKAIVKSNIVQAKLPNNTELQ